MKILVVHNFYSEPGGEDYVYRSETDLLRENGHVVEVYEDHNDRILQLSKWKVAISFLWNMDSARRFERKVKEFCPDIVHFHNIFPLISPSVYGVCWKNKIPMVQSLHNSRIICPGSCFFRKGSLCMDCFKKDFPWPGVRHKCYHNSFLQTFLIGLMSRWYYFRRLWQEKIGGYIVFSQFYRQIFIKWGIPENKVFIKPHFIAADPGDTRGAVSDTHAIFVGRLDARKGIMTLIKAWEHISSLPLLIAGEGEGRKILEEYIAEKKIKNVNFSGNINHQQMFELIQNSKFLVVPSEAAETFGLVVIEAFACGIPVLCSDAGGLKEIVEDGNTGKIYSAGNKNDLIKAIEYFINHPDKTGQMGRNARRVFEEKFCKSSNYKTLIHIYESVIRQSQKAGDKLCQFLTA